MAKSKYYHYYVEGETELKMVAILKTDYQYILPGKIEKFNIIQEELTSNRIRALKKGTTVVLIFDTDTTNTIILDKNIKFIKNQANVSKVLCITQVSDLEDELKRSCNIRQIKELTGSKSNGEFKNDMIKQNDFKRKLDNKNFNFNKFWISSPQNLFAYIKNDSEQIKKIKP